MKKIYIIIASVIFPFLYQGITAQTTIWSEDFPYSDGTTQGSGTPPRWTVDVSNCNFGSGDHFDVRTNRIEGRDTDGEAIWYSESIDISAYSDVKISIELSESGGMEGNDYLRVYYSLDGGPETFFETNGDNSDDFTSLIASQTGLNGSTVAIVIRVNNNANGERHRFDNILVLEPIAGDDCSNAIAIGEVTDYPFSTTGATVSGADPGCGGGQAPVDIWFAYTAPADGIVTIDLCGSTYDTRLAVWDACGGNVLLCNDDDDYCGSGSFQSYLSGQVTSGTTYYIQVGGYNTDTGDGDITITFLGIPTNDDCANATPIGEVTDQPFSTLLATVSGADPGCGGGQAPVDIWYAYTAPGDGIATVDLCGSTYDTRLAVWDACGGNVLLCNDDDNYCGNNSYQSYLSGAVSSGTIYYIQVGGYGTDTGNGDITITFTAFPPNDDCANATSIGEVTDLPFSTFAATQSGENPGCGGATDPYDIWYAYTATVSGMATFDLCGSGFNTRLAIWDACGGTVLDCNNNNGPACPGQQSSIEMAVASGITYYVQVGGRQDNQGDGDLSISVVPFPENNDCANATAINEVTDLAYSTTAATASGANPGCGGGTDPIDIWYAYIATESGTGSFDLCGSTYDTRLAIWDACGGNVLACNDDDDFCGSGSTQSYISMEVTSGTLYYVQVSGYNADAGDGDLTISVIPEVANDDCANATPVNEINDLPFTTIGATAGGDDPGCGGGQPPVDIWYAYTATVSGTASFDLCGSSFDTRLAIWDACGGTVIACNDDDGPVCSGTNASIEINVSLGSTYYVQVGGYNTDVGNGDLTIYVAQDVQNTLVFDGYDDYVSVSNTPDINTGGPYPDKTIEVWFNTGMVAPPVKQVIYEQGGGTRGFNIYIYNGSVYVGAWNNADGVNWQGTWLSTNLISANRWHHVALRLENGNDNIEPDKFKGFLDGVEFGSGDGAQVYSHGGNISIGRNGNTKFHDGIDNSAGEYYNDKIEEIRIWNEARSLEDIRNDMHRELPYPLSETNLAAYYKFNQSTGTALPDNSGNGHNGTLHNIDNANWVASTAPIPYYSVLDGNWDVDNSWALGQMAPVHDWSRVLIENDIHLNQDQTLKSLVIYSGGILTVDAGQGLTMDGDIANLAGISGLVIKADASSMGSLIHTTADVPATVEEYLISQRWHYVSAPVSGATIETYFDIYLMEFDEPTGAWTYLTTPVTTPMNVGEGYAAWASDGITGSTTVSFEGDLNAGDITYTSITYTPASNNTGYNLIGNPYPSSLEWNSNWNTTNIDATAYFWDGTQNVTWNRLTGTGTAPSGIIPSTQGFVVMANNSSASLTFPQSERINSNQQFYKQSSISSSVVLEVAGNGYSDEIIVGFDFDATNSFDSDFDGYDFRGLEEAPQLYTMGEDVEYAVNILSAESENVIVPVGLEVGAPGMYSISVEDLEGLFGTSYVVLEDLKENTITELNLNDSYSFYAELSDISHRFNIHFNNNASSIEDNNTSDINIYSYDDLVYIQQQSNFSGEISIYNMMGQKIATENATGEGLMRIKVTNGTGYYLVKVQSDNQIITKKVFIR